MKNKKTRSQLIIELIRRNCIGSQNELAEILKKHGVSVTQATLSRDLKAMHITKVANAIGEYMYIMPDTNGLRDSFLMKSNPMSGRSGQWGVLSLEFSGNLAVIKTRNGYATGLAYDIDMSHSPLVLGTIPGADTVIAVLREGITHAQAREFLSRFMPHDDLMDLD